MATAAGVAFIDADSASVVSTVVSCAAARTASRRSPDSTTRSCTPRPAMPRSRPTTSSPSAATRPRAGRSTAGARSRCRDSGSLVAYDEASQQVHILGLAPGGIRPPDRGRSTSSSRTATRSTPTPGCPTGSTPAAWAADFNPDFPSEDRQQILVFGGDGAMAAIDTGWHAFAWRLPGVIAGAHHRRAALPAGPDPVPAPPDRRAGRRCSSSPTGCSSSSRGSG